MTAQEQLQQVEQMFGFTYPPSFLDEIDTLRRVFPSAILLLSLADVGVARTAIPERLLPFMCEQHPQAPDIYAFDLSTSPSDFQVAVWCDHAVVMDWSSFTSFLVWARDWSAKSSVV